MLRVVLSVFLAIVGFGAAMSSGEARAEGAYVPSGSYLNSCTNVSFDPATKVLTANCKAINEGSYFKIGTSPLNTSNCADNSIWNDDGQLYCLSATAWGDRFTIPPGSYIQTCANKQVMNNVLMARCGTGSGGAYQANLNLNDCEWGGDISNQHGVLRCQTKPLTAKSLMPTTTESEGSQSVGASDLKPSAVKPLIVPQGIVQPVTLSPIAPAGSSDAGDEDSGKRKKKQKHDRGERG